MSVLAIFSVPCWFLLGPWEGIQGPTPFCTCTTSFSLVHKLQTFLLSTKA